MEKKLGQDPAFANEYHNGVSKRLYVAKGYADIAYKIAEETKVSDALKLLGLDSNVAWNYAVHLPALIVKFQYILADEFLKQENNG